MVHVLDRFTIFLGKQFIKLLTVRITIAHLNLAEYLNQNPGKEHQVQVYSDLNRLLIFIDHLINGSGK